MKHGLRSHVKIEILSQMPWRELISCRELIRKHQKVCHCGDVWRSYLHQKHVSPCNTGGSTAGRPSPWSALHGVRPGWRHHNTTNLPSPAVCALLSGIASKGLKVMNRDREAGQSNNVRPLSGHRVRSVQPLVTKHCNVRCDLGAGVFPSAESRCACRYCKTVMGSRAGLEAMFATHCLLL